MPQITQYLSTGGVNRVVAPSKYMLDFPYDMPKTNAKKAPIASAEPYVLASLD